MLEERHNIISSDDTDGNIARNNHILPRWNAGGNEFEYCEQRDSRMERVRAKRKKGERKEQGQGTR